MVKPGIEKRLTDSIETTLNLAEGLMTVDVIDGEPINFSQSFSCPDCGISIDEIEPRSFSFNNPFGACPECFGLGYKMEFDEDLMIPDKSLSINQGAIAALGWQSCMDPSSFTNAILRALCEEYKFDLDTPFEEYPKKIHDVLIYGTNGKEIKVYYKGQRGEGVYDVAFEGLIKNVERRYRETGSDAMKAEYETFMRITPCHACKGQRLKREALAVTIGGKNIYEVTAMSIENLQEFLNGLELTEVQKMIGGQILKEIRSRIEFLIDVGLEYLTLSRAAGSLSGGEAQRIRLATQIGSGLVGVAYILDEPSIGLHQRDNDKLLATLKHLRDLGNSLIVVEHDEDTMLAKRFEHILHDLGMAGLEHPLFYHAPVGIRFKIGGEEPIYLDRRAAKLKTNPAYVQGALDRAAAIYRALPAVPDLLRIDGYPDEEPAESLLTVIRQRVGLPVPDEQLSATEQDEDGDTHAQVQFYWDLSKISFQPELLLREIILGDIGGWNGFVSSVYLAGPGPFLYHLYDDRGLDVLGGSQKLLLPLYHQFHDWILEYDLEKIDQMFAPAKE